MRPAHPTPTTSLHSVGVLRWSHSDCKLQGCQCTRAARVGLGLGEALMGRSVSSVPEGRGGFIPCQETACGEDWDGPGWGHTRERLPIPTGPVGVSGKLAGAPGKWAPLGQEVGGTGHAGKRASWGVEPEPTLATQELVMQDWRGPRAARPGARTREWRATVISACRQHNGAIRECSSRTISRAPTRPNS